MVFFFRLKWFHCLGDSEVATKPGNKHVTMFEGTDEMVPQFSGRVGNKVMLDIGHQVEQVDT